MDIKESNLYRGVASPGGAPAAILNFLTTPKRPTYTISPEAYENQALAAQEAFGTSPAVQRGIDTIDQNAAQDVNTAQQYTSNTNSILNLLRSINSNRNASMRDILGQSANIQAGGRRNLMGANTAMIDERDKAWNYNVNQPYQNQIAAARDFQKSQEENFWKMLDTASSIYTGGLSKMGGGFSGMTPSTSSAANAGDF